MSPESGGHAANNSGHAFIGYSLASLQPVTRGVRHLMGDNARANVVTMEQKLPSALCPARSFPFSKPPVALSLKPSISAKRRREMHLFLPEGQHSCLVGKDEDAVVTAVARLWSDGELEDCVRHKIHLRRLTDRPDTVPAGVLGQGRRRRILARHRMQRRGGYTGRAVSPMFRSCVNPVGTIRWAWASRHRAGVRACITQKRSSWPHGPLLFDVAY